MFAKLCCLKLISLIIKPQHLENHIQRKPTRLQEADLLGFFFVLRCDTAFLFPHLARRLALSFF